jgi:hypothetical protein
MKRLKLTHTHIYIYIYIKPNFKMMISYGKKLVLNFSFIYIYMEVSFIILETFHAFNYDIFFEYSQT